jgi:hypothetical protein
VRSGSRLAAAIGSLVLWTAASARAEPAPDHDLRTGGEVTLRVGERGAGSLTVAPRAGAQIPPGAPLTVRLSVRPEEDDDPAGLELGRRRLHRTQAADPRADAPRFDLPVVARAPGRYRVEADVRFWVCRRRTCRPVRDRAEIPVVVAAPSPPPDEPSP